MRITSKGQVTLLAEIREKAGFLPHNEVDFILEGDTVRPVRSEPPRAASRGQKIVRRLLNSATDPTMTTDEIMKLTRDEG
jgi:bifunctional DNA-binding transcriptional regulator/antitoxin component of YhaV-PrlF toxin-antitoxin module